MIAPAPAKPHLRLVRDAYGRRMWSCKIGSVREYGSTPTEAWLAAWEEYREMMRPRQSVPWWVPAIYGPEGLH